MFEAQARERVLRGIQFLNDRRDEGLIPELDGWETCIDLEELEIHRPSRCILGQLFGGYYNPPFPSGFGLPIGAESHFGFDLSDDEKNGPHWGTMYTILTRVWCEEIVKLRG